MYLRVQIRLSQTSPFIADGIDHGIPCALFDPPFLWGPMPLDLNFDLSLVNQFSIFNVAYQEHFQIDSISGNKLFINSSTELVEQKQREGEVIFI